MKNHRWTAALLGLAVAIAACTPARPSTPPPQRAAPVVLVSLDGFRPDYIERYAPPTIGKIAREGVRADAMIPVFPSLTFPNHYTLVTGLYPEQHGIVANSMYDPVFDTTFSTSGPGPRQGRWWGGEPIWVTAQRQGLKAFTFFWPGTEAEIGGVRPGRWFRYDGRVPYRARVDSVLAWLSLPDPPSVVTLYFDEPDHTAHDYGPFSDSTRAHVLEADSAIAYLDEGMRRRGIDGRVNLILVSDHGMAATEGRTVYLEDVIDLSRVHVVNTAPILMVRPRGADTAAVLAALRRLPHVTTWMRNEVPERLRFRNHRRITPIVGLAEEGWWIQTRRAGARPTPAGMHGYDNQLPSMRALFLARGPAFRTGARIPEFQNIHVYSLLVHLMGIAPAANEGNLEPFRGALR